MERNTQQKVVVVTLGYNDHLAFMPFENIAPFVDMLTRGTPVAIDDEYGDHPTCKPTFIRPRIVQIRVLPCVMPPEEKVEAEPERLRLDPDVANQNTVLLNTQDQPNEG